MVDVISKLLQPYDRAARLWPALLTVIPILVLLLARFGDAVTIKSGTGLVLVSCGGLFLLARTARNAGKALEQPLANKWGGMPSTQLLRHANQHFDRFTKDRYHKVLAAGIGQPFPTAADEQSDPRKADALYASGIRWLIEQTRDTKKYAHLFKENIAYGFHRNMLGLRPVGIVIALGAFLIGLFLTGVVAVDQGSVQYVGRLESMTFAHVAALLVPAAAALLWSFAVTEESVKKASFAYAERLLQACEGMGKPTKAARKRSTEKAKEEKNAA